MSLPVVKLPLSTEELEMVEASRDADDEQKHFALKALRGRIGCPNCNKRKKCGEIGGVSGYFDCWGEEDA